MSLSVTRTPLDVARDLFRFMAERGHLMTTKEAAEIAGLLVEVHSGDRAMPRKGTERHFDTLILERRGDSHYLRLKGAAEPILVLDNEQWLHGEFWPDEPHGWSVDNDDPYEDQE